MYLCLTTLCLSSSSVLFSQYALPFNCRFTPTAEFVGCTFRTDYIQKTNYPQNLNYTFQFKIKQNLRKNRIVETFQSQCTYIRQQHEFVQNCYSRKCDRISEKEAWRGRKSPACQMFLRTFGFLVTLYLVTFLPNSAYVADTVSAILLCGCQRYLQSVHFSTISHVDMQQILIREHVLNV